MADTSRTLEILRGARSMISNPKHWFQGDYCNEAGDALCAVGALNVAAGLSPSAMDFDATYNAEAALECAIGDETAFGMFNDSHTHAEVLAAFDKAIATLGFVLPREETPNADSLIDVLGACRTAGEVVARHIVSEHPEMDAEEMSTLAAAELFYAAQDTARVATYAAQA